jgi:hypothetical protein
MELREPLAVGVRVELSHAPDRAHPRRTQEAFGGSGYGSRGGNVLWGLVDRAGLEPATS